MVTVEWGDKGCVRNLDHPIHLAHHEDDGCEYCCMQCNTDGHRCPNCGTVSDHFDSPCGPELEDCYKDWDNA